MDRFAVYLVVVAVLCTLISVITEFTKEVGVLKKIPTSFQVLITSVIVCEVGLVLKSLFKSNLALMRGVLRYIGISKMYIYQNYFCMKIE